MEMVNAFQQEDNKTNLFLISLKAGNTGLTLTAADYVFLFDPWWNNAVEQQAIDRTHRIGQTKNVFAYRLICKDTIEERIMQLQEQKKVLAGELIGEGEHQRLMFSEAAEAGTGISERRIAAEGQLTSDLATVAAERAPQKT